MNRSRTLPSCLKHLPAMMLFAFLLVVSVYHRADGADRKQPNILFIMSDDHGYQAISAYGSKVNKTPNIDRIAKGGLRFDRCFVTNSICGPSRAVILTGKYSHLNGFIRNGNRFNGQQQHVAKLLQKAGYQTAVVGKWHLASAPTGFDYYHVLKGQGPYYNPPMLTPDGEVQHTGYTTDIITDEALKFLKEKRDPEKPFYLMYQHKAPHRNWQPGPKYLDKYNDVEIPEPATLYDDYSGRGAPAKSQAMTIERHLNEHDLKLSPQRNRMTPEQKEVWNRAYGKKNAEFRATQLEGRELVRWKYQRYAKDYLRCIDSVDENVGRVLDYLEATGLDKNTVVIYTSDQGWYLGEHGWYDKRWMYEESFRTPCLIRWPGVTEPASSTSSLAMNLDFAETFLDMAGAEIPQDMQGRSLVPLLEGKSPENWRKSVYYHYYEYPGAHSVRKHYGVRTDRYKLIHFYEPDVNEWELFDLQNDPNELKSVYNAPGYQEVQKQMHAELEKLREQYQDDGSVVNFNAARARKVKLKMVQGSAAKTVKTTGKAFQTIPSGNQLDPSYKPLTLGGFVKSGTGQGVLIAQGGESLGYALALEKGVPVFMMRAQGVLKRVEGEKVDARDFVHLVVKLDADGVAQILVNGEPSGKSVKLGLLPGRPADGLSFGADSGSLVGEYSAENGMIGEVRDLRLYWGVIKPRFLKSWMNGNSK
ncbi:MAG: sulfatase [Planctomycetota bacterium]|nr:sulfatase [Planctomycetota bacterium]